MKQAKKKKRSAPITLVVLVVLLAVVAVQLIRVYGQLGEAKTQREMHPECSSAGAEKRKQRPGVRPEQGR